MYFCDDTDASEVELLVWSFICARGSVITKHM